MNHLHETDTRWERLDKVVHRELRGLTDLPDDQHGHNVILARLVLTWVLHQMHRLDAEQMAEPSGHEAKGCAEGVPLGTDAILACMAESDFPFDS